jgi:hypothetical protein
MNFLMAGTTRINGRSIGILWVENHWLVWWIHLRLKNKPLIRACIKKISSFIF